jgi:hypothetical protein
MTEEKVRQFQSHAQPTDWEGNLLVIDGILGPKTRWAMQVQKLPDWRRLIVSTAVQFVGTREVSPNRSPTIDRWNEQAGAKLGSPWCASFFSMLWDTYAPTPPGWTRDASVARLVAGAHRVEYPQPGDGAFWLNPDGTGHVGIVIAAGGGQVASVDGNLGDRVRTVRYPRAERKYCSPILAAVNVPEGIARYARASGMGTR